MTWSVSHYCNLLNYSRVSTADQSVLFLPQLTDGDGNIIDSSIVSYELVNTDSGETSDITSTIVENAGVWEASTVGNYSITAWAVSNAGYNISETVTIAVDYGKCRNCRHRCDCRYCEGRRYLHADNYWN